ncbi:MAG: class IV adenylate cyclase [Pirellulales bacterium]
MPQDPTNPTARRNIELKARIDSLEAARETCARIASFSARERQTDTYFRCSHGRLKLRERMALPAQLVGYARANATTPRASDYWLVPVSEPSLLKAALAATLGVLVIVEKQRDVFLYQNVRIHLDRVSELGEFVEFEAVLAPGDDEQAAFELVSALAARLGVETDHLIDGSYSDLLLVKQRGGG